jgi:hypothetical protein
VSYWLWIAVKKTFAILTIIVGLGLGYFAYIESSVVGAVFGLGFLSYGYTWLFNKKTFLTSSGPAEKVENLSTKELFVVLADDEKDIDLSSVTVWGWLLLAIAFFVFLPLLFTLLTDVALVIEPTWDSSLFLWWISITVSLLGSVLFFWMGKIIMEKLGYKVFKSKTE